jgi:Lysyl oxidase
VKRRSLGAITVLIVFLLASAWAPVEASPVSARGMDELLPDLITLQPTDLRIVSSRAKRRLLLSSTTANVGAGPVELQPRRRDCNGDGDPANDRLAIQRLFRDANGDGVYERRIDVAFDARTAGCFEYSVPHGHWHLHDFAAYELWDPVTDTVIASNTKVGFCIRDTLHPFPELPGSPLKGHYRDCTRRSVQGSSVGYADIYQYYLPKQWIDVAGVPDGTFCLVTSVDPANQLAESDEMDNAFRQSIELRGDVVLPLAAEC